MFFIIWTKYNNIKASLRSVFNRMTIKRRTNLLSALGRMPYLVHMFSYPLLAGFAYYVAWPYYKRR